MLPWLPTSAGSVSTLITSPGEVELVSVNNVASASVGVTTGPLSVSVRVLGGGNVGLTLTNTVPGRSYVFQATSNFATPSSATVWTSLSTNVAVGGGLSVTNTDGGSFTVRYYRVIEQ